MITAIAFTLAIIALAGSTVALMFMPLRNPKPMTAEDDWEMRTW